MKIPSIFKTVFTLLVLSLAFTACDKKSELAGTFVGEEATFGFGKAYTYVINDDDGLPIELGVAVDAAAFDNFNEMSGDTDVSIDFPAAASSTPFKHQYMGYAPHGHEPLMIYGLPHFDLHYYTSTEAERLAISPFDTIKAALLPSADYFPAAG